MSSISTILSGSKYNDEFELISGNADLFENDYGALL